MSAPREIQTNDFYRWGRTDGIRIGLLWGVALASAIFAFVLAALSGACR